MDLITELAKLVDDQDLWERSFSLKRNEYLNVHGTICQDLFFIQSGSMKVYFEDEETEQILRLAYSGDILVALDSYIKGLPSNLFIQAIKKTHLKKISRLKLMKHLKDQINGISLWADLLELSLFGQLEREMDLLTSSPLARYKRVFDRSPRLFQEIPDKYIASYLRMTPETFSRIKSLDQNQDLRKD